MSKQPLYPHIRQAWGKIPREDQDFQSDNGWERPVEIYGWGWAPSFNRWSAYVRFTNGKDIWTYPRNTDTPSIKLPMGIEDVVIQDAGNHKLVKIYRNGRVYAAHYAEPFPTR
jgi:hypothetical protein